MARLARQIDWGFLDRQLGGVYKPGAGHPPLPVRLMALIQESLSVAAKTGALATKDLERVAVDTTVQPKAIAHPTDARLTHRTIEKLVAFAKRNGIALRQSYLRLAKRAAIMVGRYTHAHQFKRANRELKFLRTRLGRLIRKHAAGAAVGSLLPSCR